MSNFSTIVFFRALSANSGSFHAYLEYENVSSGLAEDWLVSPKVIIPSSATSVSLSYYERDTYNDDWGSNYSVKVSTSSQTTISSFVDVVNYTEADLNVFYTQNTIDLSSYAGQEVYIAFVMSQDGGDDWYLDDITILSVLLLPLILILLSERQLIPPITVSLASPS